MRVVGESRSENKHRRVCVHVACLNKDAYAKGLPSLGFLCERRRKGKKYERTVALPRDTRPARRR